MEWWGLSRTRASAGAAGPLPPSPPVSPPPPFHTPHYIPSTPPCADVWSVLGCGVCAVEGAWAYKSGSLLSFSEQQLIDCAAGGQDTCDQGGDMHDSWTYLLTSPKPSPETESAYPYTAQSTGQCLYSASSAQSQVTFSSSVDIAQGSETQLAQASAARPAVAVAIDASAQSFQFYSSGVYAPTGCSTTELDHAVTVVGVRDGGGTGLLDREELVGDGMGDGGILLPGAQRGQHVRCGVGRHLHRGLRRGKVEGGGD